MSAIERVPESSNVQNGARRLLPEFQILLVEDDPGEARLFELSLREAAPRTGVYWVCTGAEGLEYLRRQKRFQEAQPAHLIVCDLSLPGMDGFGFLAEVRRDPSLKGIPVVVYSSSEDPKGIQRAYLLGANSYIVKPMTLETTAGHLEALVHYWLEVVALPDRCRPVAT